MPSSATITAFYNFSANTKARASQVNTNFDVFRGHIIPVHPSTSTSANNTYDLGSYDYKWRTAYITESEFGTTSTASWKVYQETTSSDLIVSYNGSLRAKYLNSSKGMTTSSDGGAVASSALITSFINSATAETIITGSSLTIASLGKGVRLFFTTQNDTQTSSFRAITSGTIIEFYLRLYRNNVFVKRLDYSVEASVIDVPPESMSFFDYGATTSSSVYHVTVERGGYVGTGQRLTNLYFVGYALS